MEQIFCIWIDFNSLFDKENKEIDIQYQEFLLASLEILDTILIIEKKDIGYVEEYLDEKVINCARCIISDFEKCLSVIQENSTKLNLVVSKKFVLPEIRNNVFCCSLDFRESEADLKKKSLVEIAKEKLLYTAFSNDYEFIIDKNTEQECEFLKTIFHKNNIRKGRILDCFCGCGRHDVYLNKYGFFVDGVDISEQQIENAKKNNPCSSNHYYVNDIRNFTVKKDTYNAAICMWTSFNYLSNINDMEQFVAGIERGLQNGGIFVLDTKNFCKGKEYKIYTRDIENDELIIKILIIKRICNEIQNSRYLYFIENKNTGSRQFYIDKEIIKIYKIDELIKIVEPFFDIQAVYGDFLFTPYKPHKSDRIILILKKRD